MILANTMRDERVNLLKGWWIFRVERGLLPAGLRV